MCDGDKTLVLKDRTLTKIAKRNMQNIVPLYYEMKKAKGGELNNQAIYDGMSKAFTCGNVGPVSNNVTKIWNHNEITPQEIKAIKWLCMESNFTIDSAKTLYMPTRPKEIDKIIKSYTKADVPYFFQFAKDKLETQCEKINDSAMNRLCNSIPSSRIKYCKTIGKFDWRMLLNQDYDYTVRESSKVIELYNQWLKNQYRFGYGDDEHINENELYKYQTIRNDIINKIDEDIDYIVNSLVAYAYTVKKGSNKKMLWACFGEEIVQNLKRNVTGNICPICGKRFEPNVYNQVCCSDSCKQRLDVQKRREIRN